MKSHRRPDRILSSSQHVMHTPPTRRHFLQSTLAFAAAATPAAFAQQPTFTAPKAGQKKGYAIGPLTPQWDRMVTELKAKWVYGWTAKRPATVPEGIDWVPMIHRDAPNHPAAKALEEVQAQTNPKPSALLGFNEPDRKEQANMTVEQALALWPKLEALNLPLGSPSGAQPDGEWMLSFMKQAAKLKYRIDFVTVHWYGGANGTQLLSVLDRIAKLYDRPIWLTEFCPADWTALKTGKNKNTEKDVLRFIQDTLPKLERASHVHRYSWFCTTPKNAALGTSSLFDNNGTLTPLGKAYAEEG